MFSGARAFALVACACALRGLPGARSVRLDGGLRDGAGTFEVCNNCDNRDIEVEAFGPTENQSGAPSKIMTIPRLGCKTIKLLAGGSEGYVHVWWSGDPASRPSKDFNSGLGQDVVEGEHYGVACPGGVYEWRQDPKSARIRVVGKGGDLGDIMVELEGSRIKAAEARASALVVLRRRNLVSEGTECTLCGSSGGTAGACCFDWMDGAAMVGDENKLRLTSDGGLSLRVTFDWEYSLDPALVKYVSDFDSFSAADRKAFADTLRTFGITSKANLDQADIKKLLPGGLDPQQANIVSGKMEDDQEMAHAREGMEETQRERDALLSAAQGSSSAALDKAADLAREAGQATTKRAADLQEALRGRLSTKLEDTSAADAAADERLMARLGALESSGGDEKAGEKLEMLQLISQHGIFRGLTISVPPPDTPALHEQVVEFNKAYDNKVLMAKIALAPDASSSEFSTEQTSAMSAKASAQAIESYGVSATKGSTWGVGASVKAGWGVGSVGASASHDEQASNSEAENNDVEHNSQSSTRTRVYTKARWYMEPRQMIFIAPDMVRQSPRFEEASRQLLAGTYDSSAFDSLFTRFGTHVCLKILLGGWWSLTATITSRSASDTFSLQKTATSAIDKSFAQSNAASLEASYYGVSGKVEGHQGTSGSDTETRGNASATAQGTQNESSNVEVAQQWKGGVSGLPVGQWRASLDSTRSSNWKVIDRYINQCTGVWQWIDAPTRVKQQMCKRWAGHWASNPTGADKICSGPGFVPLEKPSRVCAEYTCPGLAVPRVNRLGVSLAVGPETCRCSLRQPSVAVGGSLACVVTNTSGAMCWTGGRVMQAGAIKQVAAWGRYYCMLTDHGEAVCSGDSRAQFSDYDAEDADDESTTRGTQYRAPKLWKDLDLNSISYSRADPEEHPFGYDNDFSGSGLAFKAERDLVIHRIMQHGMGHIYVNCGAFEPIKAPSRPCHPSIPSGDDSGELQKCSDGTYIVRGNRERYHVGICDSDKHDDCDNRCNYTLFEGSGSSGVGVAVSVKKGDYVSIIPHVEGADVCEELGPNVPRRYYAAAPEPASSSEEFGTIQGASEGCVFDVDNAYRPDAPVDFQYLFCSELLSPDACVQPCRWEAVKCTYPPEQFGTVKQLEAGNRMDGPGKLAGGGPGRVPDENITVEGDMPVLVQLTVGADHACGITEAGSLRCWGARAGTSWQSEKLHEQQFVQVSAGEMHTCGLARRNAGVHCWTGQDPAPSAKQATQVPVNLPRIVQITAGKDFTCALTLDGKPVCWGDSNQTAHDVPLDMPALSQISAGTFVCGVTTVDHTVWCWGGPADIVQPPTGLPNVTEVSVGLDMACAKTAETGEQQLHCWPKNRFLKSLRKERIVSGLRDLRPSDGWQRRDGTGASPGA